jgi:hypothetical protein
LKTVFCTIAAPPPALTFRDSFRTQGPRNARAPRVIVTAFVSAGAHANTNTGRHDMDQLHGARTGNPEITEVAHPSVGRVHAIRVADDLLAVANAATPVPDLPIGRHLVAAGAVSEADLEEATELQPTLPGRRLGWILAMLGALEQCDLDRVIAERLGVPCVTLDEFTPAADYSRRLPVHTASRLGFALLHEEPRCAWIAISDAADPKAREAASFILAKPLVAVHASREEIAAWHRRQEPGRALPGPSGQAARAQVRAPRRGREISLDSLDFVNFGMN